MILSLEDFTDGTIEVNTDKNLLMNGNVESRSLSEKDPTLLPWKELQIDIVLESSGKFNDANEAKKHIVLVPKK